MPSCDTNPELHHYLLSSSLNKASLYTAANNSTTLRESIIPWPAEFMIQTTGVQPIKIISTRDFSTGQFNLTETASAEHIRQKWVVPVARGPFVIRTRSRSASEFPKMFRQHATLIQFYKLNAKVAPPRIFFTAITKRLGGKSFQSRLDHSFMADFVDHVLSLSQFFYL